MSSNRTGIRNTEAITTVKEEARLAEWQKQIEERQNEGLGVTAWCKKQGISKSTYYHRLRLVREYQYPSIEQLPESSTEQKAVEKRFIVPVSVPARRAIESEIEIRLGELRVSFRGDVSPEALKAVIEVLRSC